MPALQTGRAIAAADGVEGTSVGGQLCQAPRETTALNGLLYPGQEVNYVNPPAMCWLPSQISCVLSTTE